MIWNQNALMKFLEEFFEKVDYEISRHPGFALGFIFLSPPFSPIRFFCAIFSNLEPDFGQFSQKKSRVWGHFSQKMSSVFNPLILVDYCTHIDKITKE